MLFVLPIAECLLHKQSAAARGCSEPHHRRWWQQMPGGCEQQAQAHWVQLCQSQENEALLAIYSGNSYPAAISESFKALFLCWSVSNLFASRTEPDLSLLSLHRAGSWSWVLILVSATSVGYKTWVIFSEFNMNNLFLKQSNVMEGENGYLSGIKFKVTYLRIRNRNIFGFLFLF